MEIYNIGKIFVSFLVKLRNLCDLNCRPSLVSMLFKLFGMNNRKASIVQSFCRFIVFNMILLACSSSLFCRYKCSGTLLLIVYWMARFDQRTEKPLIGILLSFRMARLVKQFHKTCVCAVDWPIYRRNKMQMNVLRWRIAHQTLILKGNKLVNRCLGFSNL